MSYPEYMQKNIVITGYELFTPDRVLSPGAILIKGSQIAAVGDPESILPLDPTAHHIDVGDGRIIPGLIDLHIHGMQSFDIAGENLSQVCRLLPRHGVTAFLPTTYPVNPATFLDDLAAMAKIIQTPPPGAIPLGIHLEGPYLSPRKPGMCNPDLLYPMSEDDLQKILSSSLHTIRMITFAPEEGGSLSLIPRIIEKGIVPSVGHSNADFDTIAKAVSLGLRHATHTFNAMSGLQHRNPGVVGAVLFFPEIVAQMIADGRHIHPAVMALLIKVKGVDHVCLVSDAQPFANMPDGRYHWGPYEMIIENGASRLPDGTIAGSVKLMNQMLGVLVDQVNVPFQDAVKMGTSVPARVLGLKKGSLQPGYDADITVLNQQYEAVLTLVGGRIVHQKETLNS